MEKEIKEIREDLVKLSDSMTKLTTAMIGDKLERKVGYLDQIDSNSEGIKNNENEINKLKDNSRSPWAKIGIGSAAGVSVGGIGASKGGVIISKIMEFFT